VIIFLSFCLSLFSHWSVSLSLRPWRFASGSFAFLLRLNCFCSSLQKVCDFSDIAFLALAALRNLPSLLTIVNRFGDVLAWESQISTLGSIYRRHEYHFISLPAAVAAAADAMGFDNPGFDLSELTEADVVYTPDFQVKMIGTEPQETDDGYKHVNAKGGYFASVLGQRRDDLWKALGEENAKAFRRIGSGTKHDTSSKKLDACLRIVEVPWARPAWALLVPVRNPRIDATAKSGTRLTIPALTVIYQGQEEAQAAAQELAGGDVATATGDGSLRLPSLWEGNPLNWREHVAKVKEALAGKPPIPPNVTQAIIQVQGSLENAGVGQGVEVQDYVNWISRMTPDDIPH